VFEVRETVRIASESLDLGFEVTNRVFEVRKLSASPTCDAISK
jgi:hypothetical protein